jgi:uncharacterized protein (TIGR00255 family)
VNRKTLDLTIKIPDAWESLEVSISELVRKVAARGKVHVDVELSGSAGPAAVEWDDTAVTATLSRLSALAAEHKVHFQPSPELLWSIVNSQRRTTELPAVDVAQPVVSEAVEAALRSFVAMRAKEGETLLADFLARLGTLRSHLQLVAERSQQVPVAYRETLLQRLKQAGLEFDLNDERVLKEVALFADRCDISEEITRFRSHLEQFEALLKSNGEIGRKAEFILQELGREVHTMGSKGNDLTIARSVIELKNELERVREQIANVE